MAADCVAKNFSNNNKFISYSDTIKNGIINSDNDGWSKAKVKSTNRKAAPVIASHQSLPSNTDQRNKSKKHRYNASCTVGTGTIAANGTSLAYVKPNIPQNKVLVVAGLGKAINRVKLQTEINRKAGRHVNLIHLQGLSRTINQSRTVAIELDDTDYDMLSKSDFWEEGIRTWPFQGRHFWYYPKRKSPQEARNSVRESWA